MKVLVLTTHYRKGGAEKQLGLIAKALKANGVDVQHLCLAGPVPASAGSVDEPPCISLGVESFRSLSMLSSFFSYTRGANPDVILSCVTVCDALALLWRLVSPGRRWVMREPQSAASFARGAALGLRKWLGLFPDLLVANSKGGYEYWRKRRKNRAASYIPNILDSDEIKRLACASADAEQSMLLGDARYCVCVGRLEEQKNFGLAIHAMARLPAAQSDLKLLIVGEGSQEQSLKNLAAELGLADRVVFSGYLSNPYPWVAGAVALLLPSHYEGLPNVAMEALVLKVPVVLADIPELHDAFDGDAAFFFATDDSDDFAQVAATAIEQVFPVSEQKYLETRKQHIAEWDESVVGQEYLNALTSLFKNE